MTDAKNEGACEASASNAGLGANRVWEVHYHDGRGAQMTRVIAHCIGCARYRFERQNSGCRVSVVMPVPNEQVSSLPPTNRTKDKT